MQGWKHDCSLYNPLVSVIMSCLRWITIGTVFFVCFGQSLTLDATMMSYPPASVCTGGTETVQQFLCDGERPILHLHLADAFIQSAPFIHIFTHRGRSQFVSS